ncbi:MAG: hypothetical protein ACR2GZ_10865, partial [Solirubrobacteraceae bacterium]
GGWGLGWREGACFSVLSLPCALRAGSLSPRPAAIEQTRLLAGVAYSAAVYFATGHAPGPAARSRGRGAAPVRMAGLVAGGLGYRRLGDRLLVTGSALATAAFLGGADSRPGPLRAGA